MLDGDILGRLVAVVVDGNPEIFPVNYVIHRRYIRLSARALTGRRFRLNRPDIWNTRVQERRRASFE